MNKIRNVNICPKCYASDYYISNDNGLITGQEGIYVCNNCGFRGTIFPKIDINKIDKIRKTKRSNTRKFKLKNKKLNRINLVKALIVFLLIFITYTAYRFGLFEFTKPPHKHAISFFSRYMHFK